MILRKALCLALISSANAFTFTFSSQPSQCQSLTAQWSGGTGPYHLFLVPVGHVEPEVRRIMNIQVPANQTSISIPALQFPENSQFVAVLSDSTGFGTGGTSTIYTVGSGSSGCLPSGPSKADFYMYMANPTPSQCGSFGITWDSGVSDVHIYGVIPGGQSFDLGAPTTGTGFDWTANVRQGTQMLFLATGGDNKNGGSTDITTVAGGSSGCINAQSPSSTANPPAGAVSTAQNPSNPGQTGTSNPTGSAGVTNNPGATGSPGATGNPGATESVGPTATGGSPTDGNSPAPTGGNGNGPSTTRGSGGGTVTGDPNLPAATGVLSGNGRKSVNLGAIIGGALGGLGALLIGLLVWLLCARRRRAHQDDDNERLISPTSHRRTRTDLLGDSVPIMRQNSGYGHDWFRAEPFVPPMSAAEFARRTGSGDGAGSVEDGYHDQNLSGSSLGHGAVTNSSAAAAMYGALARTPSYSTSGHGHQRSTQNSHSRLSHSHSRSQSLSQSHSHSQNISHSPAHSSSRHGPSRSHSRSFSNPFSFTTMTPTSNVSRTRQITPPTPMSAVDPFAAAIAAGRPPPSSWNNQASGSSNAVPRVRRSTESNRLGERKSEDAELERPSEDNEPVEADVVDLPPTYASLKPSGRRVMNP